jgi:hypothetical protein
MVLRGDPGIGKTAPLRYVTDRAAGFAVVRCVGVESEMELPCAELHDLCTPLLSRLPLGGTYRPRRRDRATAARLR